MDTQRTDRFLSLSDSNFVDDVTDDLKCFLLDEKLDSVLIFPPVSNYLRFLIHKTVEEVSHQLLSTFSVGVGDERRTVVCYKCQLLSDEACAPVVQQPAAMGLSQADKEDASFSFAGAVGDTKRPSRAHTVENLRSSSSKPRRPDRAVYVPRALRASDTADQSGDSRKRINPTTAEPSPKQPKPPRDKSLPGTPKKSGKQFCNVYTPPHLRSQRSHTSPNIVREEPKQVPTVPNSDTSAIDYSDNNICNVNDIGDTFYIGDYFNNGQLGLYAPHLFYKDFREGYSENDNEEANGKFTADTWPDANELNMAVPETNRTDITHITNGYNVDFKKDDDAENDELRRASQEINRSNKRLMKQTFHSDVLIISDPTEPETKRVEPQELENKVIEDVIPKPKQKLEARISLKREENDWDAVFDDSGECLDPTLLEELTSTVGKVRISKPKNNYEQYQTQGQALFNGPIDETLAHVVEVYDFPSEFKTNDLLSIFSEYKEQGFEIKWVDDTHALIVFSSAKIAAEVLSNPRPLVRCRPLHQAGPESRNKARRSASLLQPYRQRPETCTALARRLVSGALGVKLSTASQERAEERRLIALAKEKKRQAALHKEAAWEGSLGADDAADNT